MIILRWSIFIFSIIVPNVRCLLLEKCFSSGVCEESLEIDTLEESMKEKRYNPLYLIGKKDSYKLALPEAPERVNQHKTNVKVEFTSKEKLIYACPKILKNSQKEKVSAALSEQDDIMELFSKSQVVDASCVQKVEPMMRSLNKSCGKLDSFEDEFRLYEVGFKVSVRVRHKSLLHFITKFFKSEDTEKYTWHTLYVICYNTKIRATLYATHTLHGKSVGVSTADFNGAFSEINEIESMDGKRLQEPTDTSKVSMNKIYKQESVKALFVNLFGKRQGNGYFTEKHDYLAKGHLVPDADMTFIPLKNATYLYSNAVPMWQIINNGVWKSIEINIRKLAEQSQENLTIYTGVYKILSYKETKIFLGGKDTSMVPVPLCIWKVVHNEKKNQAIAFVVINDPYEGEKSHCPPGHSSDTCDTNGWPKATTIEERGRKKIMCCYRVEALHKAIPYVPNIKNAGVLKNLTEVK